MDLLIFDAEFYENINNLQNVDILCMFDKKRFAFAEFNTILIT